MCGGERDRTPPSGSPHGCRSMQMRGPQGHAAAVALDPRADEIDVWGEPQSWARRTRLWDDGTVDECGKQVSALLREAAETHHLVFRLVDGDDPDWASWYADWLLEHSELPGILGVTPIRSHLVHALVQLDRDFSASTPELPWEAFYARGLLERFAP